MGFRPWTALASESIGPWKEIMGKPRKKRVMISYLANHFRYCTDGHGSNRSYARRIKMWDIKFPDREVEERAWQALEEDEAYHGVRMIFDEFSERHGWHWQIGTAGRSGGYVVLFHGGLESTNYKSFCPKCGQRNFTYAPDPPSKDPVERLRQIVRAHGDLRDESIRMSEEVRRLVRRFDLAVLATTDPLDIIRDEKDNISSGRSRPTSEDAKCGRCGHGRRTNYKEIPKRPYVKYEGVDDDTDFSDWSYADLKDRVDLVWDFNKTVDLAIAAFIEYCEDRLREERNEGLLPVGVGQAVSAPAR